MVAAMNSFTFRTVAACALAATLPAFGQSVPAFNVTDMWLSPAEPGWAISLMHSSGTNQVFALWHTYDPRESEPATSRGGDYKPIWIVMTGGTWTTPTTFVGDAFVTNGTSFWTTWIPGAFEITRVGRFTLDFTSSSRGTFRYEISPPPGISPGNPAFGLPVLNGSKSIQRFDF
jgi:hypothetical protein